jgi:hypothetical protein
MKNFSSEIRANYEGLSTDPDHVDAGAELWNVIIVLVVIVRATVILQGRLHNMRATAMLLVQAWRLRPKKLMLSAMQSQDKTEKQTSKIKQIIFKADVVNMSFRCQRC